MSVVRIKDFWALAYDGREPIIYQKEHPNWRHKNPPTIGVTWDVWCSLCNAVIAENVTDYAQKAHLRWHSEQIRNEIQQLIASITRGEHYEI